jgi:lipopolysaccharide/colanic/teichoic acid biosynthesis glycosyltransferase
MRILGSDVGSAALTFSREIGGAGHALVAEPAVISPAVVVLPVAAPGDALGAAASIPVLAPRPRSGADGMVFAFLAAVVAALTAVMVTAALTVVSVHAAAVTLLVCLTGLVALVGAGQCVDVRVGKPVAVGWIAGAGGLSGVALLLAGGVAPVALTLSSLGLGGVLAWSVTATSVASRPQPRKRVVVVTPPADRSDVLSRLARHADPVAWLAPEALSMVFLDGEVAPGQRLMDLSCSSEIDAVIVDSRSCMVGGPVARLRGLVHVGFEVWTLEEFLEETEQSVFLDRFSSESVIEASRATGPGSRIGKAVVDLVAGVAALVLLAAIGWMIALAVKLDSPGPALYRQRRLGLHGREFHILKFRTMRADAESAGAMFASSGDPRITAVGRFLRRSRLDELPQAVNLLRRDMGLIGPRPERPEFVAYFRREIPGYDHRHAVRPGLTGWAQVTEGYADDLESTRRKVARDLYYLKRQSASLDYRILLQTARCFLLLGGR